MEPLLSVKNLSLILKNETNPVTLVSGINIDIYPEKTVVLLGETGSGKTLTALSIQRILADNIVPTKQSQILLEGVDLLSLPEVEMNQIRGGQIAMIFQEPMTSLNPVMTIGQQMAESLKLHQKLRGKALRSAALALLQDVNLSDSENVFYAYPHQLSGGMKQRIMIAMALAGKPKLLIADEPTSALDVTTQAQILKLLKDLQLQYGMSILFITHDLKVAAHMADHIAVMHQGAIVEQGAVSEILSRPTNPYTQKLLHAYPTLTKPTFSEDSETVLSVEKLKVRFPIKRGLWRRTVGYIPAVEDVSLRVREGETVAVVGESGCGKTTLARAVMSLLHPTSGKVEILGNPITKLKPGQLHAIRSEFQIVFQDPFSSMNPRFRVKEILEEGMLAFRIGSDPQEREERINVLLEQVGLLAEHKYRYPHQLSGGQRQRICIARALAVGPRLLVCDEPTSSLDVSVQAQILDLLIRLQTELEIAYLFITHNIEVVRAMAHQVAVMQAGRIVEFGSVDSVLQHPQHPYTKRLLAAAAL